MSSYIHTMRTGYWKTWPELQIAAQDRYPKESDKRSSTYSSDRVISFPTVKSVLALNVTFVDFLRALELRAQSQSASPFDDYFMPQRSACDAKMSMVKDRNGERGPGGMYLVPIEALTESLKAVGDETGVHLNDEGMSWPLHS